MQVFAISADAMYHQVMVFLNDINGDGVYSV